MQLQSVFDKNLRHCVQRENPVFLIGGTLWWVRQHVKRFQTVNQGEMKQFYETCLLVPGPLDNDLECGVQIPPLHLQRSGHRQKLDKIERQRQRDWVKCRPQF